VPRGLRKAGFVRSNDRRGYDVCSCRGSARECRGKNDFRYFGTTSRTVSREILRPTRCLR
jgi:hypothetical protein